jgi:hypothetical protein
MTTQLLDRVPGTPITLGTNSNTAVLTMKNKGAVYAQSAKFDFGANFAGDWYADLLTKFGSAPTANLYVDLWIGYSGSATAGTDNWGGCTGADGAYSGYSGGTAAQSLLQLDYLGRMPLDANTTQQGRVGPAFTPKNRYGYVVWYNASGQTTTNVDADHVVSLRPVNDRAEAAA